MGDQRASVKGVTVENNATIDLASGREAFDAALAELHTRRAVERLWAHDPSLWKPDPADDVELSNRMGWLDLPHQFLQPDRLAPLDALLRQVHADGIRHVVVCGMGGSSLAPEVFRLTFGAGPGFPELTVLDFTDPTLVRSIDHHIDVARTLFLISSKSGGTIEVMSFLAHYWELTGGNGHQFCAITDGGTSLERLAQERGFRHTFVNPSEIGGRYSALSYFGLVPAALLGIDVRRLLEIARTQGTARCAADRPVADNAGAVLGAFMGGLARAGRDKLTLLASPRLSSFGLWVEQLIAESTGKEGTGIVPVVGEPFGAPDAYGDDRAFVVLRLTGDDNIDLDGLTNGLRGRAPLIVRTLDSVDELGAEMYCWEVATALAGALLNINPFDQPNVQESKDNTARVLASGESTVPEGVQITPTGLREFLDRAQVGDYVSIQAYLTLTPDIDRRLQELRRVTRDRTHAATTLGYGPRFLHSTGQLHKGGPPRGVFLQLTYTPPEDVPIPGKNYTFSRLYAAQALGDLQSLHERGLPVARLDLGSSPLTALDGLAATA